MNFNPGHDVFIFAYHYSFLPLLVGDLFTHYSRLMESNLEINLSLLCVSIFSQKTVWVQFCCCQVLCRESGKYVYYGICCTDLKKVCLHLCGLTRGPKKSLI